jgi:adenylate cyclase
VSAKPTLWAELKRRNVVRVAAAYAVVAWLLMQAADILLGNFGAPGWVFQSFVALLALGFPLALFLAWAYELTPDGIRRSEDVAPEAPVRTAGGQRIDWVIIGGLALVLAIMALERLWPVEREADVARAPVPVDTAIPASARVAAETSIAVLAFEDLSPERDQEYFAEGMSEEILNLLARVPGLRVAGRTSSFQFKGRQADLREIGELLGVQALLEGSVRKAGDRLRITVQLINATDGFHLWSETYDRELTDIFAIQDDISQRIVMALRARLLGEGESEAAIGDLRVDTNMEVDPETHALYLRGMHHWHRRRIEDFHLAIEAFEAAVERRPGYAPAHAGLALAAVTLTGYDSRMLDEMLARARESALRALELDPGQADAHAALGLIYRRQGHWAPGERHTLRALELNPSHVTAHHWLSQHLVAVGRLDEALELARRAVQLDPISVIINNNLGFIHGFREEYEEAVSAFEATLRLDPAFPTALSNLWGAMLQLGRVEEALDVLDRLEQLGWPIAPYVLTFTLWHRDPALREQALADLEELAATPASSAYHLASLYARLGLLETALDWLERAHAERHYNMPYIVVQPPFRVLWGHPRYERVVREMDLDEVRTAMRAAQ